MLDFWSNFWVSAQCLSPMWSKTLRTGHVIENKLGYQFDVKLGDYANLVAIIGTGTPSSVAFSEIQDNKVFVLEKVEK